MEVEATTAGPLQTAADTIVIGLLEGERIAHDIGDGTLQALVDAGEAQAKHGCIAMTHAEGRRFVLAGLGAREQLDGERARRGAAPALARARELGSETLCWEVPHHVDDSIVAGLVEGTVLRAYRFTRYKPEEPPGARSGPAKLIVSAHHDIGAAVNRAAVAAAAQNRARDLGNTPSNDLTPTLLGQHAERIAAAFPNTVSAEVLAEREIHAAGMGALSAIAAGSVQEPRVIVLDYTGPGCDELPPLGLIGKGVTFDSGGLWLKPGQAQKDMKFDMCGAAAVLETVWALATLEAPVRVKAVVGAVENLPGPEAVKPGDIVRALDGTTIEVNNTDAEGRLVLGDCLTHAIRNGCTRLVDIATLTGGVVAALGYVYAGLFGNDDALVAAVEASAERTGELAWRLPLHSEYAEMVKGRFGQITNLTERREAMASTAAEFLHHFAHEVPWAHLDIAGVAWNGKRPYYDRGGTGFGVRLLLDLALSGA